MRACPGREIRNATDAPPSARAHDRSMTSNDATGVKPGYIIEIHGHRVGDHPRLGEILEVLGEPGHTHYRVRWEDDREAIVYPAEDATIRPPHGPTGE